MFAGNQLFFSPELSAGRAKQSKAVPFGLADAPFLREWDLQALGHHLMLPANQEVSPPLLPPVD